MGSENNLCVVGGPKNAQEAFDKLNGRLGKLDKTAIRGDIDIVKHKRLGTETITMYLLHDQGYDPIWRFIRVRSSLGFGSIVTYRAQAEKIETNRKTGKLERRWKDIAISSTINANVLGAHGIIWYSALFALTPKACPK